MAGQCASYQIPIIYQLPIVVQKTTTWIENSPYFGGDLLNGDTTAINWLAPG